MMKMWLRFRLWLSGVIYPGYSRGLIRYDGTGWLIANIKFDGVGVTNLEHGIVISIHDADRSYYESLSLVRNEFTNSIFDGVPAYPENITKVDSGDMTPEEFVAASREFEEVMKESIDLFPYEEWLEKYDVEAKKRGF